MPTAVGSKVGSKVAFLAKVLAMIAGITKDLTTKMSLTVGGLSMTQAAILAKLAAIESLFDAVTSARNGLTVAVAVKNAGAQDAKQFMADLKKAVEAQFGSRSPLLPDFGIALPKAKAARTTAEKAASAALGEQTRTVRGTKGKKQKAKVTVAGSPGVVVVGPDGQPLPGVTKGGPTAPATIPVAGGDGPAASLAAASGTPTGASAPAGGGSTPAGGNGSGTGK
ncbi:MAG: hypothetical protein ACYDCL_17485 [Myxococcales bacterium]